jgi:Holliday junction DNA helicase RuvA
MIGRLTGKPELLSPNEILIDVHDVGYKVFVTPTASAKIVGKNSCTLVIYTNVRDDAIELYGFLTRKELELFILLLSVSGVGPKTALKIVDFGVSGITNAVVNADVSFFSQIPKVGKKSAQKIIIELKSKLGSLEELDLTEGGKETHDIIETLTSMGFDRQNVIRVLKQIPDSVSSIEGKIRYALKELGK